MIIHEYIHGAIHITDFYNAIKEAFKKIGFQKLPSLVGNLSLQKGSAKWDFLSTNDNIKLKISYNNQTPLVDLTNFLGHANFTLPSANIYLTLIQNQSNYYISLDKTDSNNNQYRITFAFFLVYDITKENIIDILLLTRNSANISSSLTASLVSGLTPTINTIIPNDSLPVDLVNQTVLINGADPIIEVNNATYGVLVDTQIMVGTESDQIYQINNDRYLSLGGFGIKID